MNLYLLVNLCGAVALLYGIYAAKSVLSAPAGNERMQEIAAAIQEGAAAFLNRQYTAIAVVGVIIGFLLGHINFKFISFQIIPISFFLDQ